MTTGIVLADRDLALPVRGVARQHADDAVDAALDAAGKIVGLETRQHGALNDDRRQRIGQRALEAVADFDAHLVLGRCNQEQDAIVFLRLAELPEPEQLVGEGLDVAALQRFHCGDDELDAGFVLQVLELGFDIGPALRSHDVRLIDDAAGQRRKVEGERKCRQRAEDDDRDGCARGSQRRVAHQNFTAGGFSAPSLAVNSAIGLASVKKNFAQITVGNVRSDVL